MGERVVKQKRKLADYDNGFTSELLRLGYEKSRFGRNVRLIYKLRKNGFGNFHIEAEMRKDGRLNLRIRGDDMSFSSMLFGIPLHRVKECHEILANLWNFYSV